MADHIAALLLLRLAVRQDGRTTRRRGERPAGRAELLANRRHIGSALRCRPVPDRVFFFLGLNLHFGEVPKSFRQNLANFSKLMWQN